MGESIEPQHVRSLTLPSGRAIEVVYYRTSVPRQVEELHICPRCASELVYPVRWSEADTVNWAVELRCPECEHRSLNLYDQATVDRFDSVLYNGAIALANDLHRLERANMEEVLDRFVRALNAEAVLPEDF